jgi:thiol-disulfide isomerase/thioredoxin
MKIEKKNLVLLLVIMTTVLLSCCNSRMSNTENVVLEDPKTDDYELLRNPGKVPQRMSEDLSGRVIVLSESDFIERITDLDNPKGFQYKGQTPCIVALYANWCRPCTFQSEVLNNLAPEYQGRVIFYKIDIDRARGVSTAFKVTSIPMILYFKPHGTISNTLGFLNKEELTNAIDQFLLNL